MTLPGLGRLLIIWRGHVPARPRRSLVDLAEFRAHALKLRAKGAKAVTVTEGEIHYHVEWAGEPEERQPVIGFGPSVSEDDKYGYEDG